MREPLPPLQWRYATTFAERWRGLLFHPPLAPAQALRLRPCNAVHTIGMAYPIDVVFVGADGRVIKVVERLAPCRVAVCRRAVEVIELAAGQAKAYGLLVGTRAGAGPRP